MSNIKASPSIFDFYLIVDVIIELKKTGSLKSLDYYVQRFWSYPEIPSINDDILLTGNFSATPSGEENLTEPLIVTMNSISDDMTSTN